jgi:acyl-CoA hydrolase
MEPKEFLYHRLVKSEDLNHHRTLFAGRCAEWFVEAGFIAAASILPASNIVCLKIHGLSFTQPIQSGNIVCFKSKIVYTGRSSLKVYVALNLQDNIDLIVEGFITFIHVNQNGKPKPHGLSLELTKAEDIQLNKRALTLK